LKWRYSTTGCQNSKKERYQGCIKKEPAYVVGNGKDNLLELMLASRNVRFKLEDIKTRNSEQLDQVLPEGQRL
jgi:hypothetical protein